MYVPTLPFTYGMYKVQTWKCDKEGEKYTQEILALFALWYQKVVCQTLKWWHANLRLATFFHSSQLEHAAIQKLNDCKRSKIEPLLWYFAMHY